MRPRLAILILAGSAALGGCAYGYGGGYGSPYGGLSVGVGYGSGYGGYGGYGGHYGSRYGSCLDPYWGWYNGFYYPGTGYYVYDSYRRPHVWSDSLRRYWTERRERARADDRTSSQELRTNWEDFTARQTERRANRLEERDARRSQRLERTQGVRTERQVQRPKVERPTRATTRSTASERRAERRAEREARRSQRDDE